MLIGGKEFRVVDLAHRTVRHDGYILALLSRLGVDQLVPLAGEEGEAFAMRIYRWLVERQATTEVVSAFLLPEGVDLKDWRPETAAAIREHLDGCSTEADRQQIYALAAEVVLGFFRHVLRSLENFQNSSLAGGSTPDPSARRAAA